jgi:hypothetical protein
MWGHPIWWWGRVGKVLQFLAAFTIIAEIIGAEQIRTFGHSLHGKLTVKSALKRIRSPWKWSRDFFKEQNQHTSNLTAERLYWPLRWIVIGIGFYFIVFYWTPGWITFALLPVWFLIGLFLTPMLVAVILNCFAFLGLLIDFGLIEPTAWIIDREHLDKWIKIGSIFLLLAGFHFDLLSS